MTKKSKINLFARRILNGPPYLVGMNGLQSGLRCPSVQSRSRKRVFRFALADQSDRKNFPYFNAAWKEVVNGLGVNVKY